MISATRFVIRLYQLVVGSQIVANSVTCAGAEIMDYPFRDSVISVCKVDVEIDVVRMFWRDENKKLIGQFTRLNEWLHEKGERLVCATNGGIYDQDFRPRGLYIETGATLRRLNKQKDAYGNFYLQPNGVFLIRAHDARIVDTDRFDAGRDKDWADARYATQSGPLLLQGGVVNPILSPESENRLARNAVCTINRPSLCWRFPVLPSAFMNSQGSCASAWAVSTPSFWTVIFRACIRNQNQNGV
jgi:uncharacterized protein YigE (DUF2233 family)